MKTEHYFRELDIASGRELDRRNRPMPTPGPDYIDREELLADLDRRITIVSDSLIQRGENGKLVHDEPERKALSAIRMALQKLREEYEP